MIPNRFSDLMTSLVETLFVRQVLLSCWLGRWENVFFNDTHTMPLSQATKKQTIVKCIRSPTTTRKTGGWLNTSTFSRFYVHMTSLKIDWKIFSWNFHSNELERRERRHRRNSCFTLFSASAGSFWKACEINFLRSALRMQRKKMSQVLFYWFSIYKVFVCKAVVGEAAASSFSTIFLPNLLFFSFGKIANSIY